MDEDNPCPPSSPIYINDEFTWSSPLVYCPILLLAITLFIGIPRYIYIKRHYQFTSQSLFYQLSSFSKIIIYLCLFVTTTFVVDGFVIITRAILNEVWTSSELAFYFGICWLSWVISLFFLFTESQMFGTWYWNQYLFWEAAFVSDTIIGWLWLHGVTEPKDGMAFTIYDHFSFGIFITRYIVEITIVILSCIHLVKVNNIITRIAEASPLLGSTTSISSKQKHKYGTTNVMSDTAATATVISQSESSTFRVVFQKMNRILPFIWPQNNTKLQIYFVSCFFIMSISFAVNLLAPRQIGLVVDELKVGQVIWSTILIYVGLRFLQGGSGLLQTIQNWFWLPIGQHTTREISLKTFNHLQNLSLDFHISRKTGEVLRVMDRGTSAIMSLLNQLLFQILPIWANILLISIFTAFIYAPSFGLILFLTMVLYIYVTIAVTDWRTKVHRSMAQLDTQTTSKLVDNYMNYETVKYYNAEDFEMNQYKHAILEYQKVDWKSSVSLNILSLSQNAIITGGLLCGCLLFAHKVAIGEFSTGDFVAFVMYLLQLYTPLHWFGTYYRIIQSSFIDVQKMFALLDEVQSVKDVSNAKDIIVNEGNIVFENVTFSYDKQQTVLDGVSFKIPKGSTVALVGPPGGGKSTILRLLFRFYDTTSGHIYIDGQDIRQVTQKSLRKHIGVIPQENVLFNDSIYYNINYGNIFASREDIIKAAKAAHIHDKIETFPEGYRTIVGEKGLRLSNSEKQRVSIARTLLKNPPIVLLDEAVGSLDSTTEKDVQHALSHLTKKRTTIMIAHRLNTIVNANLILVVKNGKIVESGSHEELINKALIHGEGGVYFDMWQKQLHEDTSETFSEASHSSASHSINEEIRKKSKGKSKHKHRHQHSSRQVESQVIEIEEERVIDDTGSQALMELIELDEEEEEQIADKNPSSSKLRFWK